MKLWRKRRLWAMWIFNASYFSPCACFLMGRTAFLAPASPSFSLLTSKVFASHSTTELSAILRRWMTLTHDCNSKALPDATPRFTKLDGSNSARGFRNNISPSSKSFAIESADRKNTTPLNHALGGAGRQSNVQTRMAMAGTLNQI